ncbi:hypothetical protein GOBAR_DD36559 [Gossypium barbadense]|nr:hypothetical protein GOBAR_DD36559 [Gossypium barbadense]
MELSHQNALIQLFAELADVEQAEDPTPLCDEHRVQDLCMVVSISYVDCQSIVRGFDIDLNVALETDADDGTNSSDPSDHEVDGDSDLDVYEVSDDIHDEGANDDGNVNESSVKNLVRHIVICNDPGAHMSLIDLDATHLVKFLEYPDILPAHRLVVDSEPKDFSWVKNLKPRKSAYLPLSGIA